MHWTDQCRKTLNLLFYVFAFVVAGPLLILFNLLFQGETSGEEIGGSDDRGSSGNNFGGSGNKFSFPFLKHHRVVARDSGNDGLDTMPGKSQQQQEQQQQQQQQAIGDPAQILSRGTFPSLAALDAGDVIECYALTRMARLKTVNTPGVGGNRKDQPPSSSAGGTNATGTGSNGSTVPGSIFIRKTALAFRYKPQGESDKPPFELTLEYGPHRTGVDTNSESIPIVEIEVPPTGDNANNGGANSAGEHEQKFVSWENEAKIYYRTQIESEDWTEAYYMAPITGAVLSKMMDFALAYPALRPRYQPFEVALYNSTSGKPGPVIIRSSSSEDFVWYMFQSLADLHVDIEPILIPPRRTVQFYVASPSHISKVSGYTDGGVSVANLAADFFYSFYACANAIKTGDYTRWEPTPSPTASPTTMSPTQSRPPSSPPSPSPSILGSLLGSTLSPAMPQGEQGEDDTSSSAEEIPNDGTRHLQYQQFVVSLWEQQQEQRRHLSGSGKHKNKKKNKTKKLHNQSQVDEIVEDVSNNDLIPLLNETEPVISDTTMNDKSSSTAATSTIEKSENVTIPESHNFLSVSMEPSLSPVFVDDGLVDDNVDDDASAVHPGEEAEAAAEAAKKAEEAAVEAKNAATSPEDNAAADAAEAAAQAAKKAAEATLSAAAQAAMDGLFSGDGTLMTSVLSTCFSDAKYGIRRDRIVVFEDDDNVDDILGDGDVDDFISNSNENDSGKADGNSTEIGDQYGTMSPTPSPRTITETDTFVYIYIDGANYFQLNLTSPFWGTNAVVNPVPAPLTMSEGREDPIDWILAMSIMIGFAFGILVMLHQMGVMNIDRRLRLRWFFQPRHCHNQIGARSRDRKRRRRRQQKRSAGGSRPGSRHGIAGGGAILGGAIGLRKNRFEALSQGYSEDESASDRDAYEKSNRVVYETDGDDDAYDYNDQGFDKKLQAGGSRSSRQGQRKSRNAPSQSQYRDKRTAKISRSDRNIDIEGGHVEMTVNRSLSGQSMTPNGHFPDGSTEQAESPSPSNVAAVSAPVVPPMPYSGTLNKVHSLDDMGTDENTSEDNVDSPNRRRHSSGKIGLSPLMIPQPSDILPLPAELRMSRDPNLVDMPCLRSNSKVAMPVSASRDERHNS